MAEIDNLKVQEQLNKVISDRRAILASQTREMQSQLQVALQLKAVMDGMSADDLSKRLEEAQKALDGIGQNAQNINQVSSQAMDSISKGAGKASEKIGKLEKATKLLVAKYPALKNVGTAALSGLFQGFTNLLSIAKGVTGVVEGIVSGIFSLGKAILSIPLRIFQGLVDSASSFTGDTSLAQAFENLRKEFGSFKEDVSKNVIGSFHQIQNGLTGTGLSAMRVLGTFSEQLKYFTEEFQKAGAQASIFGDEMAKAAGVFTAYEKGLAIGDNLKAMMDRATESGTNLSEQFRLTANYSLQMGKDFGISQKILAKDIGLMMKDVKNFGSLTQKEMSIAAVYTRKLGLEVTNLLGLADKFDNFEDAATTAAQLNQAFGASVDAFKIMQEQVPAKRIDMLRKAMAAAGKTTENMSNQELKLLASTTGLDEATAKLAFSSKNQGVSYDDIQKKAEKAQKSQLTQAQAMSKLADSIERFIMQGQQLKGGFFQMFMEGFERGIKSSAPFLKLMVNLRSALMQTMYAGVKIGKAFVNIFPGMTKSLESLAGMFAPEKFQKLLNGVVKSFEDFFKDIAGDGKFSVKKLLEALQKNFFNWFDDSKTESRGLLDGAKSIFKGFVAIVGQGIKWVIEKLTSGLTFLADFIRNPSAALKKLKGGAGGAAKGAMGLLEPLITALGDAKLWGNLWNAIKGLFSVVFEKIVAYFSGPEFGAIAKKYWPVIAAVLFGPALTRMLVAALLQTIMNVFSSGASGIKNVIQGGISGITKSLEKVPSGGGALSDKNIPKQETMGALEGTVRGLAKLKASDIIKAGLNAVIMATFIGTGLIELVGAIGLAAKVLEKMNVKFNFFAMALAGIAAIALASIPLVLAIKVFSKLNMGIGELLKGLGVLAVVVAAAAGTLGLIVVAFNKLKLENAESISKAILNMTLVYIAAAVLIPVAAAIGLLVSGPQAVVLGFAAAGIGVLATVVAAMATTTIKIMKELDGINFGGGLAEKVKMFTDIMKAIGALTGNIAQIMEAVRPSFMEVISGKGDTLKNMQALQSFVNDFIGADGRPGGITGLIKIIMDSVKTLGESEEMMKAAEMVAQMLGAVGALAQALVPPADTKSAFDSIMNTIRGESSDTQLVDLTNYAKRMVNNMSYFFDVMKGFITSMSTINLDEGKIKALGAVGTLFTSIVDVLKALIPSPETLKALQTTMSQSGFLGIGDIKITKQNPQAISAMGGYFKTMMQGAEPIIKALTDITLKNILELAKGINKDDYAKIELVTKIISGVAGLISGITAATQNIPTKVEGPDVTIISSIGKTFESIMTTIKNDVGPLIQNVIDVANRIPTAGLKDLAPKLDDIQKAFGVMSQVSGTIKGFQELGGRRVPLDAVAIGKKMTNLENFIKNFFIADGPVTRLINAINNAFSGSVAVIYDDTKKGVDNLGNTAALFAQIKSGIQALDNGSQELGSYLNTMQTKFGESIKTDAVSGLFNKIQAFSTLLADQASGAYTRTYAALKSTQDVIKSVNELNKLLESGDVTKIAVSTNLRKFAQSVNLGGTGALTIQNRGITMSVTMNVVMNAEELEEALVFRKSSIIREGIKDSVGFDSDEPRKTKLNAF